MFGPAVTYVERRGVYIFLALGCSNEDWFVRGSGKSVGFSRASRSFVSKRFHGIVLEI